MMTGWLHISGHDLWSNPCASTARPRSSTSTASVERPPASEISYIARIRFRWGGRVAKKWQNMTREGRAWCPPKMMTSWYEQPLMRLQLNTKLTCINLSSSFPLIQWNISKLGSWTSRIIYFCKNTHCLPTSHINLYKKSLIFGKNRDPCSDLESTSSQNWSELFLYLAGLPAQLQKVMG